MGTGSSKVSGGGGSKSKLFNEVAFDENKQSWDDFVESFGPLVTSAEKDDLSGYIATGQSFSLNEKFYDKTKGPLTPKQQKTVDALDKAIGSHETPANGIYTRYVDSGAIKGMLGLNDSQMGQVLGFQSMKSSDQALLSKALSQTVAFSPSYTSTSAVTEHLFSHRLFKREISVPKGTKAYAAINNKGEHEVVFGRNMRTKIDHVSWDGKHIVFHEVFDGYEQ